MGVTPLDLVGNVTRPVTVEFEGGATLALLYQPGNYSGEVERLFNLNMQMGREIASYSYLLARLIDSWDMEHAPDDVVRDFVSIPAKETSATVEHDLGFKPKPSQLRLECRGAELDPKAHVKRINDTTFEVVIDEAGERNTPVFWEVSGLAGIVAKPSERFLQRLPFPVLQHIAEALMRDLFPNRRGTFAR